MTSSEILKALDEGFTLHSSNFGFWLISPIDPSFSKGGDAAAAAFVLLGIAQINGKTMKVLEKTETLDTAIA